ncbi:MAG TPA: M48 family metalloprotease [Hyphomicrobiaceae bacterium]|nr:M48 family metalloprotease [Hyphomicrobiaceae bacterium]
MSMPSDPTLYGGSLSDGRTAAAVAVRARLGEAGLEILPAGERRAALVWPYAELQSSVPLKSNAPDVLLSLKPNGSQTLFVANPAFSQELLARASGLSATRQRLLGLRPGIAIVAIVAALAASVRFLDLHPAQTIARMLPQQTREAMGRSVVAQLTGHMKQCDSGPGRIALDRLASRLVKASGNAAPVRVVMIDWALVNAFATPGGQIIMTRGLVQKAGSPDEVAGVLAHEIGHTIELHPEAGLVRAMGLSAAAQLIFAGTAGTATNIGLLLTQLRYTRVAEREADGHAVRILKQAGISAKGFGDFFERLEPKLTNPAAKTDDDKKDERKVSLGSRIFASEILRSHPLTTDRLALVRAQPAYASTPALSTEDWQALREMCGATVIAPRPASPSAADRPTTARPGTPSPSPSPRPPAPAPTPQATDADRDIAEATKALEANAEDVAALQRRARAYSKKGQHAEAATDYTKATQLRPADANLQIGRGGAHYSLRQYELALVAYDEAIRLDASNAVARNSRGNTNRALKRYQEALTDFDELIKIRPTFVFAFYNRGLTNVDMGRPEDATRDFTAALGIDKDYAGAYTQRGLLHEKAGARELAIADFRAAIAAPAAKYESGPWAQRVARERLRGLGVEVR